jgi:GNAT superfamily N-acetyltransferase
VIAAVLLFGVDLLVIHAARSQKSLTLTAERLTVGEQSVARASIAAVVDMDPRDLPTLGWPTGITRGMHALPVRLVDGHLVAVPTRHPARLEAALGLGERASRHADVRPATEDDLPRLAELEDRADTVFRVAGLQLPEVPTTDYAAAKDHTIFVAGDPPVGFAALQEIDGDAYLAALAVLPGEMRAGIGSRLLDAACSWAREHGYAEMTLTTFRDVPWNAPFYARRGFAEVLDPSPGLAAVRDRERSLGLDDASPRIAMRRTL